MSICQIEEREAGRSYPRTCPTCRLTGPCAKGLDRKALRDRIEALEAEVRKWQANHDTQRAIARSAEAERDALVEKLGEAEARGWQKGMEDMAKIIETAKVRHTFGPKATPQDVEKHTADAYRGIARATLSAIKEDDR